MLFVSEFYESKLDRNWSKNEVAAKNGYGQQLTDEVEGAKKNTLLNQMALLSHRIVRVFVGG